VERGAGAAVHSHQDLGRLLRFSARISPIINQMTKTKAMMAPIITPKDKIIREGEKAKKI